jgi:hypothetical protein
MYCELGSVQLVRGARSGVTWDGNACTVLYCTKTLAAKQSNQSIHQSINREAPSDRPPRTSFNPSLSTSPPHYQSYPQLFQHLLNKQYKQHRYFYPKYLPISPRLAIQPPTLTQKAQGPEQTRGNPQTAQQSGAGSDISTFLA